MQGRCTISSIVYPFFRICHFHCCSKVPVFHVTKAAPAFHMKRHTDQNLRFLLRIETAASNHQNIQIWNSLEFLLSLLFYYFVLFWYGWLSFLIYFVFCPKKEIAPAFQRKKKQQCCAQFRMTRRRSMCFYIHIYFWANEKGRGGEREQNSSSVFIDFCVATQTAVLCYSAVEVSQETLVLL